MKFIVYSCVTGGMDNLIEQPKYNGVEYHMFTDVDVKDCKAWIIHKIPKSKNFRLTARWHKTHPHILFPTAPDTLWMDGNVFLDRNPLSLRSDDVYSIMSFRHPVRDCIYIEGIACIVYHKDNSDNIKRTTRFLKEEGYPENHGLCETNMVYRTSHDKVTEFNEDWWFMINNFSIRDQMSFNYVIWSNNLEYGIMPKEFSRMVKHQVLR